MPRPESERSISVSPARRAAFEILNRVQEGAYASILLNSKEQSLKPVDRALCHELVMGVLRRQLWLDRLAEYYSKRSITTLDRPVRITLQLALYQLRFLSRVPASAAVNESVNLVVTVGLRSARSFVNAVLRRATREPDYDPVANLSDPLERLSVETSHPLWLLTKWSAAFGFAEVRRLARANNETAPTAFRIVEGRAAESEVIEMLRRNGAAVVQSRLAAGGWRIQGGQDLLRKLARDGVVYIQDEASQLIAEALDSRTGDRVLDICAAPGGKVTQVASSLNDSDNVIAADLHANRLRTVVDNVRLQRIKNILCVVADGRNPPFQPKSFERVLLDAPCSGTGTLRRNPEIRWRISAEDIKVLSEQQKQLLVNVSQVVKPGGRLVYSTCALEPEENEEVVAFFIEHQRDFRMTSLPYDSALLTPFGAARTWPHLQDTDGFFIAVFDRK